jgi:hypothetical protein
VIVCIGRILTFSSKGNGLYQAEIDETIHTVNNTREAFRLIIIRWPKLQAEIFDSSPYFYHAIATNREEEAPEVIKIHNQRGQVENYIKELKTGFGMEWLVVRLMPMPFSSG